MDNLLYTLYVLSYCILTSLVMYVLRIRSRVFQIRLSGYFVVFVTFSGSATGIFQSYPVTLVKVD